MYVWLLTLYIDMANFFRIILYSLFLLSSLLAFLLPPLSLLLFPSSPFLLLSLPPPFFLPSSFSPSSLPLSQIRDLLVRTIEAYMSLYDPNNTTRLPQFKLQLCLEEATSPSPPEGDTHTEKDLAEEGEDKDTHTEAREAHNEGEKEPPNEGTQNEEEKSEGEQGDQTVVQRFEFYPSLSDLEAAVLSVVDTVGGAMKQVPDVKVRGWTVH